MWLVDENLPPKLHRILEEFGITARSASHAGLAGMTNGVLTKKAIEMGFEVILTQDKTFVEDAASVLKQYPIFCVVVIIVNQVPAKSFLERFREFLVKEPICPKQGEVIVWPSAN